MEYAAFALIALCLGVGVWKTMVDLDKDETDEDDRLRKKKSAKVKGKGRGGRSDATQQETNDDVRELQPYEKRLMGAPIFDNRNDSGGGGTPPAF